MLITFNLNGRIFTRLIDRSLCVFFLAFIHSVGGLVGADSRIIIIHFHWKTIIHKRLSVALALAYGECWWCCSCDRLTIFWFRLIACKRDLWRKIDSRIKNGLEIQAVWIIIVFCIFCMVFFCIYNYIAEIASVCWPDWALCVKFEVIFFQKVLFSSLVEYNAKWLWAKNVEITRYYRISELICSHFNSSVISLMKKSNLS